MWSSLLASLMLTQTPPAPPVVAYGGGYFMITDASGTTKVNTKQWAKLHVTTFDMKVGKAVMKWDWKGFTVTVGKKVRTSRLAELPISEKFFSQEQIEAMNDIGLKREVTGLSGWEQIGDVLYMVPRWEDKDKSTWLEMMIKIDLKSASPWYVPLGVLEGNSKANSVVEDRVFKTGNGLGIVSEKDGDWGLATWPLRGGNSEFHAIGTSPRAFDVNTDGTVLRFIEKTSYGTNLAGMAALPAGTRTDFAETRDPIFFPGDTTDIVQINASTGVVLRNTDSGLELRLPANVGVRNVAPGVLVWVPRESPTQAVLYSKSGLRALARWKAGAAAPKPKPPVRQP